MVRLGSLLQMHAFIVESSGWFVMVALVSVSVGVAAVGSKAAVPSPHVMVRFVLLNCSPFTHRS